MSDEAAPSKAMGREFRNHESVNHGIGNMFVMMRTQIQSKVISQS
jgi:hypothetical protein